jgi:hypothetical protein
MISKAAAPPKEASKVKLKAPVPEVPPPPAQVPQASPADGPGVHKGAQAFFGDESDDIEVIEDDVKTG